MEIVLLENVKNLGKLGEVVRVKAGYARNFLVPEKKAVFATVENLKQVELNRVLLEEKAQKVRAAAEARAETLKNLRLTIPTMASEEGKLYGSVNISEIKDAFQALGHDISKREIVLVEGVIHALGEYEVQLQLHSEVVVSIPVDVVASK
ncbi:MAG: 50S ribosomal protein L9 [Legionellaceae bacterium]|nr:50S ribosomal protein L9 [Legionellaceae bacterium]